MPLNEYAQQQTKSIFTMKKNIIRGFGLLVCAALFAVGCSGEDAVTENGTTPEASATDSPGSLAMRSGGETEFRELLNSLYHGSYTVSETPTVVTDQGQTFSAYKVRIDSEREGYILEARDNNLYYENNISRKTVTEYDNTATGLVRNSYDFSHNQYYLNHGLNPVLPTHPVVEPLRFWGWTISYGPCGPNSNGDGGSSAGVYAQHSIFWISGNVKPVLNASGASHASVPCTGNPPVAGTFTGDIIVD
jgi:hypothetical protein